MLQEWGGVEFPNEELIITQPLRMEPKYLKTQSEILRLRTSLAVVAALEVSTVIIPT